MPKPEKRKFEFEFLCLRVKQTHTSETPICRPHVVRDTIRRFLKALEAAGSSRNAPTSLDGATFRIITATIGDSPEARATLSAELRTCATALDALVQGPFTSEKEVRRRVEEFVDKHLFLPAGEDRYFADDVLALVRP